MAAGVSLLFVALLLVIVFIAGFGILLASRAVRALEASASSLQQIARGQSAPPAPARD